MCIIMCLKMDIHKAIVAFDGTHPAGVVILLRPACKATRLRRWA